MPIQDITTADDLKKVVSSRSGLVVIKASAEWCGPCRQILPFVETLSRKYETTTFLHLDVDEGQDLARELKVSAMPTFIFVKGGKEVDRMQGADPESLEKKVKELGQVAFGGAGHRLGDTAASPASESNKPASSVSAAAAVVVAEQNLPPPGEVHTVGGAWPLEVNEGETVGKFLMQQGDGTRMPFKVAPARHTVKDVYNAIAFMFGHSNFSLSVREGMRPVELSRDDARTCTEAKVAGGTLIVKML